jgi:hypothetical protein
MKKRKFQEGGNVVEPGDGVQYFADDELAMANKRNLRKEIDELNAAQYTGSAPIIDEYSGKETTTRRNLETGDYYSTEPVTRKAESVSSKAPAIKNVPGSGRGSMAGRGASDDIMYVTGGGRGRMAGRTAADDITYSPSTQGSIRKFEQAKEAAQVAERQKRLAARGSDAIESISPETALIGGAPGLGVKALHGAAKELARHSGPTLARAAKEGIETALTAGPKAGLDVARSTARGATARAEMQAKRTARQRGEAEAMEKAKPVLQARKSDKAERAARTRRNEDEAGMEFSRGGSASSRGDGCAKRGKTRGKMY